ncbi:hypothetical protein OEZ86_006070 [Tetradesmus obliquus]|nr:hypothetical protein OEZ86_006070 [Tetradesmus obliquus]
MYQQQPDLRSTEQQATLLQLLVLADKYAVPGAVAAVNRAFKETPVEQLLWETVVAVYELPAVYADNAAFADVYTAAADVLQHTLGDLELVFADQSDRQGSKQQLLYDLPHAGLLQLLRDERTRVASENTAAHALLEWSEDKDISPEHLKQLASLVRMPRCSHLYITTVLLQHPEDVVEAFGLGHLLNAAACSAAGSQLVEEIDSSPTRREYPGWFLPARPASSMQQLVIDWHVKLQDVKVMFEQRVAENRIEAYFGQNRNWGVTTFVFNGGTTAWQEAKQQLRAAHAVHADGCLHIQVIVTGMA